MCHNFFYIFTSGERQKLALINKAGSYFSVSFPQVAPYETKIVSVRKQDWAASPNGSKCPGNAVGATTERPLRQEIQILTRGQGMTTVCSPGPASVCEFMDARQEKWKRLRLAAHK